MILGALRWTFARACAAAVLLLRIAQALDKLIPHAVRKRRKVKDETHNAEEDNTRDSEHL